MQTILNVAQVLLAIAMVGFILVQRGAGATAGSAFGGGASGTVFGARGSASFLTRATAALAAGFFIVNLVLAVIAGRTIGRDTAEVDLGVMGGGQTEVSSEAADVPEVPELEAPSATSDVPVMNDAPPEDEGASTSAEEAAESSGDTNG